LTTHIITVLLGGALKGESLAQSTLEDIACLRLVGLLQLNQFVCRLGQELFSSLVERRDPDMTSMIHDAEVEDVSAGTFGSVHVDRLGDRAVLTHRCNGLV
jgi:hypothetical protein